MKIICDQCGKGYQMKDKKVTKAFKTRCKRCAHIIIVRPNPTPSANVEATVQVSSDVLATHMASSTAPHEPQAAASKQSPHSVAADPPPKTSDDDLQWYAVIQEEQGGPFTLGQLRAKWAQGLIHSETYVWRDGMAEWSLITQVQELSSIWTPQYVESQPRAHHRPEATHTPEEAVNPHASNAYAQHQQEQSPSTPTPVAQHQQEQNPSTPTPVAQHSEPQASFVVQSQEKRSPERSPEVNSASMVAHQESAPLVTTNSTEDEDLMSSVSASAVHKRNDVESAPSSNSPTPLRNQRNENSVLFSLESIYGSDQPEIKIQNPSKTTEDSGLIDISALNALGERNSSSTGGGPINLSIGLPRQHTIVARSSNLKVIVLSVISAVVLSVGGVVIFMENSSKPIEKKTPMVLGDTSLIKKNTNTPAVIGELPKNKAPIESAEVSPPSTVTEAKETPKVLKKTSKTANKPSKTANKSPNKNARKKKAQRRATSKANTSSKSKNTRKRPPPPQKRNSTSTNKSASDLLKNLRTGKSGSTKPLDLGKTAKKGPKKPSKSDIVKTMRRVNVRRCGSRDPSLKGTVKVRIKAVSSGAIIQVKTQNSPFNRSPVGSCIEREVRKQRFPSFTDNKIEFTFPFKL